MTKRFWIILIVLAVVFGVIFKLQSKKSPVSNPTNAQPTNHVEGTGQANVTLIEYGDYECPYCEQYYPTVKQVAAKYSQQIFFQFRNLPLTQLHQNAFAAARAAEAAGLQGKFWEMHDALYDNQPSWIQSNNPESFFDKEAQALGLNLTKFQQDFASNQVNDSINADVNTFLATKNDEATPTFFLDGVKVSPAPSVDSFSKLIDAEIAKKTTTAKKS